MGETVRWKRMFWALGHETKHVFLILQICECLCTKGRKQIFDVVDDILEQYAQSPQRKD